MILVKMNYLMIGDVQKEQCRVLLKYAEAVLKFTKLKTLSVASRSVCSRAKPTAHTGFGISNANFIVQLAQIVFRFPQVELRR
jgi:hypothetical protein